MIFFLIWRILNKIIIIITLTVDVLLSRRKLSGAKMIYPPLIAIKSINRRRFIVMMKTKVNIFQLTQFSNFLRIQSNPPILHHLSVRLLLFYFYLFFILFDDDATMSLKKKTKPTRNIELANEMRPSHKASTLPLLPYNMLLLGYIEIKPTSTL